MCVNEKRVNELNVCSYCSNTGEMSDFLSSLLNDHSGTNRTTGRLICLCAVSLDAKGRCYQPPLSEESSGQYLLPIAVCQEQCGVLSGKLPPWVFLQARWWGEGSSPPHSGGLSDLLNVIQDSKRNDEFNLKFTAPNTDKWFPGQSNSEGYTLASAVTPSAFSFREKERQQVGGGAEGGE